MVGVKPGGIQCAQPADAEQELLADAGLAVTAIQARGDLALGRCVVGDVGVQQQEGHRTDLQAPDDRGDRSGGKLDADPQWLARGIVQQLGAEIGAGALGIALVLSARVDALLEVPVVVEEPDPDKRYAEVGCGLEVVAGKDAEPAGVDRDVGREAELGAEVRDQHAVVRREGAGKPGLVSHWTGR